MNKTQEKKQAITKKWDKTIKEIFKHLTEEDNFNNIKYTVLVSGKRKAINITIS